MTNMVRILGFTAAWTAALSLPSRGQTTIPFPLVVTSVTVVGEDQEFGSIVSARVGANGNVYAIDHVNARVIAFSPEGRLLWKTGRKGRGPGEYQIPYRIDVAPNGELSVFDLGMGDVTTLTSAGRFVRRVQLPFSFRQVDALARLSNGDLVVSGYSAANDLVSQHGLHRFRTVRGQLVHVSSFGPLPAVRDRAVLPYWTPGPIALAPNGDLLYLLRLPYEIHRYDAMGHERSVLRPRMPLRAAPDDFVRIERTARGTAVSSAETDLEHPGAMAEVGDGWIVASRVGRRGTQWDLFDPRGRVVGSRAVPPEWGAMAGYDPVRGFLWLIGEHDDAPVLLRLRVSPPPAARGR
jgi:hypothetical protein